MSKEEVLLNEEIDFKEVRCVSDNGEVYGIISSKEALNLAHKAGLDLVLISPNAKPPVCKIMDYGKFRYQAEKKQKKHAKSKNKLRLKRLNFQLKLPKMILTTK